MRLRFGSQHCRERTGLGIRTLHHPGQGLGGQVAQERGFTWEQIYETKTNHCKGHISDQMGL